MSKLRRKRKRILNQEDTMEEEANEKVSSSKNSRIFERAIENAKKHRINLMPGTENSGYGNCSYESVILNINDRECFKEKLNMSPNYYRRVWNTDIMNKILDGIIPWNPGLTRSEIRQGFEELMESGVYERDFFGDMMMAGIACGTRKMILIFNTHEMTPHDPIAVIDPTHYGGTRDSEIPIVLAYDLVHYESLHTIDGQDIEETKNLVKSYIAQPSRYMQEYGFTRHDMMCLISSSTSQDDRKMCNTNQVSNEHVGFIFEDILFEETDTGQMKCGVCQAVCNRLIVHMNGNEYCTEYFSNMEKFKMEYSKYRDKQRRMTKVKKKEGGNDSKCNQR